jgi:hypothetical protein
LLAKHHLPGILLGNGPQKISYITDMLKQNVPGFSSIQYIKARRILAAALESRKGGGRNGDVIFYKYSWATWGAYVKGSPQAWTDHLAVHQMPRTQTPWANTAIIPKSPKAGELRRSELAGIDRVDMMDDGWWVLYLLCTVSKNERGFEVLCSPLVQLVRRLRLGWLISTASVYLQWLETYGTKPSKRWEQSRWSTPFNV